MFGSSMVIGGALGGAIGLLAQELMPRVVMPPGAFVAAGMAGFSSARVPRSTASR